MVSQKPHHFTCVGALVEDTIACPELVEGILQFLAFCKTLKIYNQSNSL